MRAHDSGLDKPLLEGNEAFEVPTWFRWTASVVGLLLIVPSTLFIVRYTIAPDRFVSPTELGVIQLILAGTVILLFALAPWKALGLRLRKVGFLEFERVISVQATEHAEALTELRKRVDELEEQARGMHALGSINEHVEDVVLIPLITRFLGERRPEAFSPLRIRDWGSRQPGYAQLAEATLASIRRVLQQLVSQGRATTTISQMGNTLYRLADSVSALPEPVHREQASTASRGTS